MAAYSHCRVINIDTIELVDYLLNLQYVIELSTGAECVPFTGIPGSPFLESRVHLLFVKILVPIESAVVYNLQVGRRSCL